MSAKPKSPGASGADAPSASAAKKAAPPRSTAARPAEGTADTPAPPKPPSVTLDLLAEKPKRVRNKPGAPPPAPEPPPPPPPPVKEVLSLIDDEPKPKRRRPAEGAPSVVQPISKLLAEKEEAASPAPPAPAPVAVPVVASEPVEPGDEKYISIKPPIIVRDLAERMGVKVFVLIKDLMELDIFANPSVSIETEVAVKICEKHGFIFEREKREKGAGIHKVEEVIAPPPPPPVEEEVDKLLPRAPIIAFMGHVDHGKTSLIDAIRKTRVVTGEAGGITQHIGAYSIEHKGGKITVLDTPGHAAFSAMRARGAHVTDIVILVIAADDGIMPQTKEAIAHAKAAGVKIVVALNKIDLKTADPDKVKMQLQAEDLMTEDWGGTTACIPVSATKGTGIDELLDAALLEAEMMELKANPKAPCRALIIESRVEAGKGPTATVIPQTGTLKIGTSFICGVLSGKVKGMLNDRGQPVKEAGPATPVEVLGFSALPNVGDELVEMENERDAKRLSEERTAQQRMEKLAAPRRATLEALFANMDSGQKKSLKLILRTDVQGSLEAIVGQLRSIVSEKVHIEFLLEGVGPITDNDIILASASDAVVIGFGVKVEGKALKTAKAEGVQIKLYSIIYELIDQVKEAMLGLLDPLKREKIIGHALVKQVFKVSKGKVGGSVVTDGRIVRSAHARVIRGKQPVYDGAFHTLRRFNDDVQEVRNGLECGIRLGDFTDYEEGDIIECYELEKIAQTL
ncbi:MAG TPA: translation initiation factor IF-2 [Verrucomicrobiales bacterium]|nr:translation initiation factor IF-2 [Verrucomicrobiales bacterium]